MKNRTILKAFKRAQRHLVAFCTMPESSFKSYGKLHVIGSKPDDRYYFRDNGSKILAVAHLDTVMPTEMWARTMETPKDVLVVSPSLDDRLGAWVICEMLPRLGIKTDVLLTTGEESMNSSAELFRSSKTYNWMFSFDRREDDAVLYQYDNPDLRDRLKLAGWTVGNGSYSCIADLDDLDCAGINFGVGYQDAHSEECLAWMSDTLRCIKNFSKFWQQNKDVHLDVPVIKPSYGRSWGGSKYVYGKYRNWSEYMDARYGPISGTTNDYPDGRYGGRQTFTQARQLESSAEECSRCGIELTAAEEIYEGMCWSCIEIEDRMAAAAEPVEVQQEAGI